MIGAVIVPKSNKTFSRMRSKGFPFKCGGLGAGGVFIRCFGLRPREGPMAGPLGNAAEGGLASMNMYDTVNNTHQHVPRHTN